jgi:hypothetical protein
MPRHRGDQDAPPEPEIGGVLGRAMERARRTGEKPPEGRARDELGWGIGDRLTSPLWLAAIFVNCAFAGWAGSLFWDSWYPGVGLVAILYGSLLLIGRWVFGPGLRVTVGTDGVLAKGQFVPYSILLAARVERQCRGDEDHDHANDRWTASLTLMGGESVQLWEGTKQRFYLHGITQTMNVVEESRAAWRAAHSRPGIEERLLERGDRSALEWAHALRRASSAATGVYRSVEADVERMSQLLGDEHAAPSARAAAAVALTAHGDATAARRLRIAAASMANPRLRVALEQVAEAADEAALADALDAVLDAHSLREPPRPRT